MVFWRRLFLDDSMRDVGHGPALGDAIPQASTAQSSASVFLILRRMRMPLIALILIFATSVLGLALIPGVDDAGRPARMGLFESFYFMSFTGSTIGYGEIPHAFTPAQRMWVTVCIYLTVIGWAYAIGSLLALLQDTGFRRAVAWQRFSRKVDRLREPFLLIVGYGATGRLLARSLDAIGRRFVVVDASENRVAALALDAFHADTPGVVGNARDAERLSKAGLTHPYCEGVLALTGDDEANLAVTMTANVLRPDIQVIGRTASRSIASRMRAFGAVEVVNPLDRFGDHLRILIRSPASYQLMVWLTSAPGTELPARRSPLRRGHWIVHGQGRFATEVTDDLRAEGLSVTVVGQDGFDAAPLPADAVGFVAATENDTTNLSLIAAARESDSDPFLVTVQNRAANWPLFAAVGADFVLVAADVIAHEAVARLASPMLMRFLERVPRQGEAWSADMVARLVERCGPHLPQLWRVKLDAHHAPALGEWLTSGEARLGDLLRAPTDREHSIEAVPLLVLRGDDRFLGPDDEFRLEFGDVLLLAGLWAGERALEATCYDPATRDYVVHGRFTASSWIWRLLRGETGSDSSTASAGARAGSDEK
jgi:Trk K+ transport system NAD-binding subunit